MAAVQRGSWDFRWKGQTPPELALLLLSATNNDASWSLQGSEDAGRNDSAHQQRAHGVLRRQDPELHLRRRVDQVTHRGERGMHLETLVLARWESHATVA